MAKEHAAALADRLFVTFVAPLVLGGPMPLGRPIGPRRALELHPAHHAADADRWTRVSIARVRVGRRFTALDTASELSHAEWRIAVALHDITQSTHPVLAERFSGRRALALLQLALRTLELSPEIMHAGDALSRHTLFARALQMTRTVTKISWWTGQATFVGTDPPPRLIAWPGARRVQIDRTPRPLSSLPEENSEHRLLFGEALRRFFERTPLTDFVEITRAWPSFDFNARNRALISTHAGRVLVLRALRALPTGDVDEALARALLPLIERRAAVADLLQLLAERALESALRDDPRSKRPSSRSSAAETLRTLAALAAHDHLVRSATWSEPERAAALARLEPYTESELARSLRPRFDVLRSLPP